MAGLIQGLEILNLPEHGGKTNWNVGDKIDLEGGKNLLLIGGNETGKTTMLKVLHESIQRASEVLLHPSRSGRKRPIFQEKNTFLEFSLAAGYLLSVEWEDNTLGLGHSKKEVDAIRNEEIDNVFMEVVGKIYGNGLINIFNSSLRSTYGQALKVFEDFKYEANGKGDFGTKSDKADADHFLDAAKKYAEKKGIPEEVMYGNLIALCNKTHDMMRYDNVSYGWIKPSGDEDDILSANRVILDDLPSEPESFGERTKRIVKEVTEAQKNTLAFLDEPTNGIDMMSFDKHLGRIISGSDLSQIFAVTHHRDLYDAASASNDWVIYDLGEKRAA